MALALIQARMASTRLPGKSMAMLNGRPLIEHVVRRVQAATLVDHVCVCTTDQPEDDPLAAHAVALGADVYRGDSDDVLGRFYWAAERYPIADPIVRITGDDPFKDPQLIDRAISAYRDLTTNPATEIPVHYVHLGGITWPLGMDVEVFSRVLLTRAHKEAHDASDREHVTQWMARRAIGKDGRFAMAILKDEQNRGTINMRWTLDTVKDLSFAAIVYEALGNEFGYDDMIKADVESLRRYPVDAVGN